MISKSLGSNISFTIFFIIGIIYLVTVLNNICILQNKNRKILFDDKKIILYFLLLLIKNMMFLDYIYIYIYIY